MTPDHKDSTSDKNLNSLTPQDVLVVIPAYNEEKIVASVITNLQTYGFKVLCVVDGCTDKTLQEVKTTGLSLIHISEPTRPY